MSFYVIDATLDHYEQFLTFQVLRVNVSKFLYGKYFAFCEHLYFVQECLCPKVCGMKVLEVV